jgi:hypothetical protein
MGKKTIQEIVNDLPPEKALKEMAGAAKTLLSAMDEQARLDFVMNLIGEASTDKVSSLVHL